MEEILFFGASAQVSATSRGQRSAADYAAAAGHGALARRLRRLAAAEVQRTAAERCAVCGALLKRPRIASLAHRRL